jgi:hypothetical protein
MQMLSDLDRIMETLWLAIGAAAAFVIAGLALHAAIRFAMRARSAKRQTGAEPGRPPRREKSPA